MIYYDLQTEKAKELDDWLEDLRDDLKGLIVMFDITERMKINESPFLGHATLPLDEVIARNIQGRISKALEDFRSNNNIT